MKSIYAIQNYVRSQYTQLNRLKFKFFFLVAGAAAFLWFLIRVIPKPSRASYPCQRAAFPMASAFVLWITGTFVSRNMFRKFRIESRKGKKLKGVCYAFIALAIFSASVFIFQANDSVYGAMHRIFLSMDGNESYACALENETEDVIEPKAIVAIVKSDKSTASDITFNEIDAMIRKAVDMAGGFDTLIHDGDLVVIKPNVISVRRYGEAYNLSFPVNANGIATDYRIIQVVVNMVREKNPSGKIVLLEGSGYGTTRSNITVIGYLEITGLDSIICLDENISSWYNTSSATLVKASLPPGKNLYSTANAYYLNKVYYNADVLISLPCLKTHHMTGITGGIKNVGIGATPVEMYGNGPNVVQDDRSGRWLQINHGDVTQTRPLDRWIHDFYLCRPVDYVIMDGLQGAQYGPFPGSKTMHLLTEVQKNMRVILAGKDPLAVDAIESLIAGVDPYLVGHLALLAADSAGCIHPAFIKVKGIQVHDIKTKFEEDLPGRQCQYSDFTRPQPVLLSSCTLLNNEIRVSVESTDEISKVEIAYDNEVLSPIAIRNFSDITIPFSRENGDPANVSVLVYDKYLNCSVLTLVNNTGLNNLHIKPLKIFPNPASAEIRFELPDKHARDATMLIYSGDGKLSFLQKSTDAHNLVADISKLPCGSYLVKLVAEDEIFQSTLIIDR